MITTKGIELLSKYIVGQAPAFASHIAIGCGATPLNYTSPFGDYSSKTSMDFEMLRTPIISSTVVNISGVNQIVYTAQLPENERYSITEIGIYPAEKSNTFGSIDSSILYSFGPGEGWVKYVGGVVGDIALETERLDSDHVGSQSVLALATIDVANLDSIFSIESDNAVFSSTDRLDRHEQPRYLNNSILLRGDTSNLHASPVPTTSLDHIEISGVDLSRLDRADKVNDEIKLSFSILNAQGSGAVSAPSRAIVMVEFTNSSDAVPTTYARMTFDETSGFGKRYFVSKSKLIDLEVVGSNFSWAAVDRIKIYVDVAGADDYFVALDALKFENVSEAETSSQYGLSGYTVIKESQAGIEAKPINKPENTSVYVEFRFSLDSV